ncbi:little elongation complex subunit 1 [Pelodytes ibericus]
MMPGETHSNPAGIASEAAGTCQNCTALQQNLNEYVAALIALKQKIIDSDHLLADYQHKCEELQFTERENETLRCQLEQMLQKITPQEQNHEELKSLRAELEEKTSSLKIYQQTQLEFTRVKEECVKSDSAKKKLEAKLKKMEDSAEKQLKDFKQLKTEKKLLEKELKKLQKKFSFFQDGKSKKGMKNAQTQITNEEPVVNVDKRKIKLLLEELWECIDSSTDKSQIKLQVLDDHLHRATEIKSRESKYILHGKRCRTMKSLGDFSVPPSHSSPLVLNQIQMTPTQLPAIEALHEPNKCRSPRKSFEEGVADFNGDSAFYEDKTTDFFVPPDLVTGYSSSYDHERETNEFLQMLDWVKPLPPLLSPIRYSPSVTQDLFGDVTDSSGEEQDVQTVSCASNPTEYSMSDENPVSAHEQTHSFRPTNKPDVIEKDTEENTNSEKCKENDEIAVMRESLIGKGNDCSQYSHQITSTAEIQERFAEKTLQMCATPKRQTECEGSSLDTVNKDVSHEASFPEKSKCHDHFSEDSQTGSSEILALAEQVYNPVHECNFRTPSLDKGESTESSHVYSHEDMQDEPPDTIEPFCSERLSVDICDPVPESDDCFQQGSVNETPNLLGQNNIISNQQEWNNEDNSCVDIQNTSSQNDLPEFLVQSEKTDILNTEFGTIASEKNTNNTKCFEDVQHVDSMQSCSEAGDKLTGNNSFNTVNTTSMSKDVKENIKQPDGSLVIVVCESLADELSEQSQSTLPTGNQEKTTLHHDKLKKVNEDKFVSPMTKQHNATVADTTNSAQSDYLEELVIKISEKLKISTKDLPEVLPKYDHNQGKQFGCFVLQSMNSSLTYDTSNPQESDPNNHIFTQSTVIDARENKKKVDSPHGTKHQESGPNNDDHTLAEGHVYDLEDNNAVDGLNGTKYQERGPNSNDHTLTEIITDLEENKNTVDSLNDTKYQESGPCNDDHTLTEEIITDLEENKSTINCLNGTNHQESGPNSDHHTLTEESITDLEDNKNAVDRLNVTKHQESYPYNDDHTLTEENVTDLAENKNTVNSLNCTKYQKSDQNCDYQTFTENWVTANGEKNTFNSLNDTCLIKKDLPEAEHNKELYIKPNQEPHDVTATAEDNSEKHNESHSMSKDDNPSETFISSNTLEIFTLEGKSNSADQLSIGAGTSDESKIRVCDSVSCILETINDSLKKYPAVKLRSPPHDQQSQPGLLHGVECISPSRAIDVHPSELLLKDVDHEKSEAHVSSLGPFMAENTSISLTEENNDTLTNDPCGTIICPNECAIKLDINVSPGKSSPVSSGTIKPPREVDRITCTLKENESKLMPDIPAESLKEQHQLKTQVMGVNLDITAIIEKEDRVTFLTEDSDDSEDNGPVRKVSYKNTHSYSLLSNVKNNSCMKTDTIYCNYGITDCLRVNELLVTNDPPKVTEAGKSDLKESNQVSDNFGKSKPSENTEKKELSDNKCFKNSDESLITESNSQLISSRPEIRNLDDPKHNSFEQPYNSVTFCTGLTSGERVEEIFPSKPSGRQSVDLSCNLQPQNIKVSEQTTLKEPKENKSEANVRKIAPGKNFIWNFDRSDYLDCKANSIASKKCDENIELSRVTSVKESFGQHTESSPEELDALNNLTLSVIQTPGGMRENNSSCRISRSKSNLQNASVGQTILANADTSTKTESSPETINKVRLEMGPPLPPLLGPLLETPPRIMRPLSPLMSSSSRSSLPSPLDDLLSPLQETPVPPMMSPLSDNHRHKSPYFTTPSPSEKANRRILSSPLQFCSATPKHALPVPGRLPPSAIGGTTSSVQENSVRILDTMYPELSARARTLNILKGNVQLNRCLPGDCKSVPVSQITGFKAITSSSTAFVKTAGNSSTNGKNKDQNCQSPSLSSNKRGKDYLPMPKSAKRLRLDSESPVTESLKDCFTIPANKVQMEKKPSESRNINSCISESGADTEKNIPAEEAVATALKKIEELCFDLLPVIRSHVHVGTVPRIPVMRNEEKEVIFEFSSSKKGLSDHLLQAILKKLKAEKSSSDSKYLQALCRVYVGLCRQLGDLERARLLCYSILKEGFPEPDKLLLFIISVWNDLFSFHGIINKAMQALLKHLAKDEVLRCLSTFLNWETSPPMNIGTILSSVLMAIQFCPDAKFQASEQNGDSLTDNLWEYVFAVDLLCGHRKWIWTHDNVISKELWPVLDKWVKFKKGRVNVPFIPDIIVAAVLRLVGRLCQMGLKEGFVTAVKNIGSVIVAFIQHANEEGMPWGVQLASVYMLCDLAPSDPLVIHKTLKAWKENATKDIPPAITSYLAEVSALCAQEK